MSNAQQVLDFINRNDGVVRLRELRHFPQSLLENLQRNRTIEVVKIDSAWQVRINSTFDKKQDKLPDVINIKERQQKQEKLNFKVKKPAVAKVKRVRVFEGRCSKALSNLFDFIKASRNALTIKEIMISGQNIGCHNTVYKNLCRLIKEEKIVSSGKGKKRYIDKDRAHLLEKQKPERVKESIKKNRRIVLEFVKAQSQLSITQDVVTATGITKRTVTRVVKYHAKRGDLVLLADSDRGNKFYFASADNPLLVEELNRLEQESPINKVQRILRDSDKPMTIGEIMEALGKKKRCGGASSVYMKKIVRQLGCKSQKRGNGVAYYLEDSSHE